MGIQNLVLLLHSVENIRAPTEAGKGVENHWEHMNCRDHWCFCSLVPSLQATKSAPLVALTGVAETGAGGGFHPPARLWQSTCGQGQSLDLYVLLTSHPQVHVSNSFRNVVSGSGP